MYAATVSQSAPISYKHIDAEFIEFFSDLYQGILNPDYFYDTAFGNNWGTWSYGPLQEGSFNTAILHQSGQQFRKFNPSGPQGHPEPFYSSVSEAYQQYPQPYWCAVNGINGYNFVDGVWRVYGLYYPAAFTPDYSYFNEDAMSLTTAFASYYDTETSNTSTTSLIFQVIGEYMGQVFGGYAHTESSARALVMQIYSLFGPMVYQEPEPPSFRTRLDLVYTSIVPVAGFSHAWLLATDETGAQFATRGELRAGLLY